MAKDVTAAYDDYEEAYNQYHKIYEIIEESYSKLARLKRKTFGVWISSTIAWLIPIILSIVLFLLS